ncbi:MAG: hypothetical protein AB7K86_19410 [Rhodospirillales bacterium]
MTARPISIVLPVAVFAAGWLALAWPWLAGAVTIPWDAKAHWQPHLQFVAAALARGDSPLWLPHAFAGMPEVADPQSPLAALPLLVLAALDAAPGFRAADAVTLASLGLGGLGIIFLFHDRGWHWGGAALAALAFAFGGAAAWRLQHLGQVFSVAWLPVALWLVERALASGRLRWSAAAGVAAGLLAIGRDQVALIGLYVLAGRIAWAWLDRTAIRPRLAAVATMGVAGLAIAAVPALLSAHLAALSNRPAIDYAGAAAGSLHPALLLTAAVPDLFGAGGAMAAYWGPPSLAWPGTGLFLAQNVGVLYAGAVPLALVLQLGVVRGLAWAAEARFFAVAGAIVLLYALGGYTWAFRGLYAALPGVDLYRRPADATFVLGAVGAILAGYLFQRLLRGHVPAVGRRRRIAEALLVALPLAAATTLAAGFGRLGQATPALLAAAVSLAAAVAALAVARRLSPRRSGAAALVVLAVAVADLAWGNRPNGATGLPPETYDALRPATADETVAALKAALAAAAAPDRRDRVEIVGLGFHWPNVALVHGFDHTLGYNPVRLKHYGEAVGAGDTVATADQRRFSPLFPSYRSTLADVLGLRFVVTGVPVEAIDPALLPGDLRPIARTREAFIYENPRALPRVVFAGSWRQADFAALIRDGGWPDADPRDTVLLETPPGIAPAGDAAGTVRIAAYRNAEVVVDVASDSGGFVVLHDVWHPWWQAEIDGRPAPMLRANVLFRAVAVPPGRHAVRFVFRPFAGLLKSISP